MKKIIISMILCFVMIPILTGCTTKNKFEVGKKSDVKIIENYVSLSIKEGTLTNTGATLILKNDNNYEVQYGNPYGIEIKENGEWHKIDVELYFTMQAFSLEPKSVVEIDLNWENGYGKLAKGEYRIIKGISIQKEDENYESFDVGVEFTIK